MDPRKLQMYGFLQDWPRSQRNFVRGALERAWQTEVALSMPSVESVAATRTLTMMQGILHLFVTMHL